MKLHKDSIISPTKLTDYLLTPRERNDKSKLLANAGFMRDNWQQLDAAIRKIISDNDVSSVEDTKYGRVHSVNGILKGPKQNIDITTFWIERSDTGKTHFITLIPTKRR